MAIDASKPELTEIGAYDVLAKVAEGGMGTVYKARRREDGLMSPIKSSAGRGPNADLNAAPSSASSTRPADRPPQRRQGDRILRRPAEPRPRDGVRRRRIARSAASSARAKSPKPRPIRILAQVCQGLHRAHKQNMIHRDIQRTISCSRTTGVAKITDLGLV